MSVNAAAGHSTTSAWWVRRWSKFMEQVGATADTTTLRGLRVKRLEVQPGLIQAQVADRDNGATLVEVRFPTLSDAQWAAIIETLGSQALFVAQLLAGNMPAEIEQVFADVGSWLLPTSANEITQQCTPANSAPPLTQTPRRALVVVYTQLGEMVAEDPWLLLRLRGRDRQQVLAALQEKRNNEVQESAARAVPAAENSALPARAFYMPPLHESHAEAGEVPGIDARIEDFWGRRKVLEDAHYHLVKPAVELALLRRLGPISTSPDGEDAFKQLQTIYHRVTQRAWDVAFSIDDVDLLGEVDAPEG